MARQQQGALFGHHSQGRDVAGVGVRGAGVGVQVVPVVPQADQAEISHRRAFNLIWNSIHGPEAWDANPWVVALTFTVTPQNIDSMEAAA